MPKNKGSSIHSLLPFSKYSYPVVTRGLERTGIVCCIDWRHTGQVVSKSQGTWVEIIINSLHNKKNLPIKNCNSKTCYTVCVYPQSTNMNLEGLTGLDCKNLIADIQTKWFETTGFRGNSKGFLSRFCCTIMCWEVLRANGRRWLD